MQNGGIESDEESVNHKPVLTLLCFISPLNKAHLTMKDFRGLSVSFKQRCSSVLRRLKYVCIYARRTPLS